MRWRATCNQFFCFFVASYSPLLHFICNFFFYALASAYLRSCRWVHPSATNIYLKFWRIRNNCESKMWLPHSHRLHLTFTVQHSISHSVFEVYPCWMLMRTIHLAPVHISGSKCRRFFSIFFSANIFFISHSIYSRFCRPSINRHSIKYLINISECTAPHWQIKLKIEIILCCVGQWNVVWNSKRSPMHCQNAFHTNNWRPGDFPPVAGIVWQQRTTTKKWQRQRQRQPLLFPLLMETQSQFICFFIFVFVMCILLPVYRKILHFMVKQWQIHEWVDRHVLYVHAECMPTTTTTNPIHNQCVQCLAQKHNHNIAPVPTQNNK